MNTRISTRMICLQVFVMLAAANSLSAQRMPMPGDRILQMFDLRETRHEQMRGAGVMNGGKSDEVVAVLRHFIDPPLRPGDDIKAIGPHWVAVLADEQRIACVDRVLQAAKKHRNDLLTIEVRLLDFKADAFHKHLGKDLVKVARGETTTYESVIAKDNAKAFVRKCIDKAHTSLAAPTLSVMPLQPATTSVVTQVPYIRDFTVHRRNNSVIADPIVDTTWEGHKSKLLATFLPDGRIGLSCEVQVQELHRPIPEAKITIVKGAQPVTVQLPRTSGVRLANVAELAPGALVVLAAKRLDGTYIVAIVKASATGNR